MDWSKVSMEELESGVLDKPQDLVCPFCHDKDFDAIGLKYHLIMYCDEYAAVDISDV